MKERFEIIYSRQTGGYVKGKAYANPRFFTTPRSGVTKVTILGHWPNVEKAYRDAGVPVEVVAENGLGLEPLVPPPVPAPEYEPSGHPDVEIPEDWRDLPWIGTPSIRGLAMRLTDGPVINKASAVAVIAAELARRG